MGVNLNLRDHGSFFAAWQPIPQYGLPMSAVGIVNSCEMRSKISIFPYLTGSLLM